MTRGRPGKSRYKEKRRSTIGFREFVNLIADLDHLIHKSLAAILFYLGIRIAEICGDKERKWKVLSAKGIALSKDGRLPRKWIKIPEEEGLWVWRTRPPLPGIRKEDIILDEDTGILRIFSEPLKHGRREGEGQLELDINYPFVNLIVKQWKKTKEGDRVWPMSTFQAWYYVKQASKDKIYPHAFRENRATQFARDPTIAIADMQQWFGWARASTADSYIQPIRSLQKARESLEKEIPEDFKEDL